MDFELLIYAGFVGFSSGYAIREFTAFPVGMGAGRETTLHVVAAIWRTLRDPHTLPVCSSIMIDEYPVQTRLVNYM